MNISALSKYGVVAYVAVTVICGMLAPVVTMAQAPEKTVVLAKNANLTKCPIERENYGVAKTVKMVVTAYSSEPEQTDDTPFITASQKRVRDGIIAINGLPFGTEVRIPSLYGDKVFVVEDRMNSKYGKLKRADIWFENTQDAIKFGAKTAHIEILED